MDHELGKNSSEKIGLFWDDTATRVWSLKGNTYQLLKQNTLSLAVYEYRTESFTEPEMEKRADTADISVLFYFWLC